MDGDLVNAKNTDANRAGTGRGYKRADYLTSLNGLTNVASILAFHAGLVAWFVLGYQFLPLMVYLVFSPVVCIVHLRAMSEWVHEASHYNLVPDKQWNDILVNILSGVFLGNTVSMYRAGHMRHHQKSTFFQTDDPDTNFCIVRSRGDLIRSVLKDISGISAVSAYFSYYLLPYFKRHEENLVRSHNNKALLPIAFLIVVHVTVIAGLYQVGRLDAYVFYYATVLTLYPLFNRIRAYGQHVYFDSADRAVLEHSTASRTVDAGLLDRVFITSRVMMYHYEHHKYPGLPWRALRAMSEAGEGADPYDRNAYLGRRWPTLSAIFRGLETKP